MKAKEGLHIDFIIYVKKRLYKCIFVYAQTCKTNNVYWNVAHINV